MAKESNEKAVTPSTPTEAERKAAEEALACPDCGGQGWYTGTGQDQDGDAMPIQVQCQCFVAPDEVVQSVAKALSATRQAGFADGVEASIRKVKFMPILIGDKTSNKLVYDPELIQQAQMYRDIFEEEIRSLLTRKEKA